MKTRFSVSQTAYSFMQCGWSTCVKSSAASGNRWTPSKAGYSLKWSIGQIEAGTRDPPFSRCPSHAEGSRLRADTANARPPKSTIQTSMIHSFHQVSYKGRHRLTADTLMATRAPVFLSMPSFTTEKPAGVQNLEHCNRIRWHSKLAESVGMHHSPPMPIVGPTS
jgi:hypothetical protein